jgi:type II secretory pathway pseudopilin PulG
MKKNKSFTIVEIMIAMSIFSLVIGGSIVLIQQTLVMISLAKEKLTAYYLAQEAIELARSVRDNNWLQQQADSSFPWDNGFPQQAFNSNVEDHSLDFEIDYNDPYNPNQGQSSFTPSFGSDGRFLSLDSNGYSYDTDCSTPSPNCTKFVRWLRIGQADGGIRIECHVQWRERGRNHTIVVKEKLFNWYGF